MGYRKNTVVISVPLSIEHNDKLYKLSQAHKSKSKTQYAKHLLEQTIDENFLQTAEGHGKTNG